MIILDDCANSQLIKNKTLETVGFFAQHLQLLRIIITRQHKSVAKPYRENILKLCNIYNPTKNSFILFWLKIFSQTITLAHQQSDLFKRMKK